MKPTLIGPRVRELREERNLTQAELARLLEISPSYLNQIERGNRALSVAVLFRLTESLGVEPEFFSSQGTARLVAELREALLDEALGVHASQTEVAEIATSHPKIARSLVRLQREHRDTIERTSALLEALGTDHGAPLRPLPHSEVRDFFYDRRNHIDRLDRAAETLVDDLDVEPAEIRVALARRLRERHGVRVAVRPVPQESQDLRRFNPVTSILRLSSQLRPGQLVFQLALQLAYLDHDELLSELVSDSQMTDEARALARIGLAQYFAGAVSMPYQRFHEAAEDTRYDIEQLADIFQVGFEAVCHRLSTLQRPRRQGVPFSFVRVDRAGNISKRQSATGFHFSRAGGSCPLWNVYEAFTTPGRILRQVAQMPDGRSYFWVARTVARKRTGFGNPAKTFSIGLGCELRHAHRLIYSDGLALDDRALATPIGMGCRTCPRTDCPQRAFPQIDRPLQIDEHRTSFAPYQVHHR